MNHYMWDMAGAREWGEYKQRYYGEGFGFGTGNSRGDGEGNLRHGEGDGRNYSKSNGIAFGYCSYFGAVGNGYATYRY